MLTINKLKELEACRTHLNRLSQWYQDDEPFALVDLLPRIETPEDLGDVVECLYHTDRNSALEYARWCALQVVDRWDAPPVVRHFLETGRYAAYAYDAAKEARAALGPTLGDDAFAAFAATSAAHAIVLGAGLDTRTNVGRAAHIAADVGGEIGMFIEQLNEILHNAHIVNNKTNKRTGKC